MTMGICNRFWLYVLNFALENRDYFAQDMPSICQRYAACIPMDIVRYAKTYKEKYFVFFFLGFIVEYRQKMISNLYFLTQTLVIARLIGRIKHVKNFICPNNLFTYFCVTFSIITYVSIKLSRKSRVVRLLS